MAYVNMLSNNEQQQQQGSLYSSFVDPRISFSNDFADTQQQTTTRHEQIKYKEAPVSSDFEFNVRNFAMIPADEIFFDGVLQPLREDFFGKNEIKKATLREELSVGDDDHCHHMISKASSWWKLGPIKSKKDHKKNGFAHDHDLLVAHKNENCLARILECDD